MSNSAISFNTAGLASTTSPGLVGTGAQTFAGKKTLDGGALIKGDTSGVAIASGYVGETATGTNAGTTLTSGSSTYVSTLTIPIPSAGLWRVDLRWEVNNSATGTTWTANQVTGSISNSSTSHDSPGNKLITTGMVPTSNAAYVGIGANCTRIVSTTNSTTNYYAVIGGAVFSGGAPVAYTTYLLTRIA